MEIIIFIAVVAIVALFVIPSSKRPDGCICKWSKMGPTVQDDCPIHKGWAEPLYPVEDIKAYNEKERTEREAAILKHGVEYNKILKDKWNKD